MITGIVEIVRQVDEHRNRQRIVAGRIRKLSGEGIEFDHEMFAGRAASDRPAAQDG